MKPISLFFTFLIFALLDCTGPPTTYAYDPMCSYYAEHHGECCSTCHDMVSCSTPNLYCVPTPISTTNSGEKPVVYDSLDSQVKGEEPYNGICEVCHTQTKYHRNNASGDHTHSLGQRCTSCHLHGPMEMVSTNSCYTCHGGQPGDVPAGNPPMFTSPASQSHLTHNNVPKGPQFGNVGDDPGCTGCHQSASGGGVFSDGQPFATTTVCDNCHSKGGTYDGVAMAKANWDNGVYEEDQTSLKLGKEQWCAGCHDESPANSKGDGSGVVAPNVIGDEGAATRYGTGYGFYKTGHGLPSGTYLVSGGAAANLSCADCHDTTLTHIDHDSRTYSAAQRNYQEGYRLKYSMDIPRTDTGWPKSDFELCVQCHDFDPFIKKTNLTSNLRNIQASGNSTDLSETVLTDSSKAWGTNEFLYDGCALIPNIDKPWNVYPITSNAATTITVSGSMLSDGASAGSSYRVVCNGHRYHLQSWQTGGLNPYTGKKWDSDWSATSDGDMQIDSMISCPTCHNVHGSKLGRMVREGELISKIYSRKPGLDFYYVDSGYSYANPTKLSESIGGHWSNGCCRMCSNCHGTPDARYYRVAKGTVLFSSAANQNFAVADPATAISTITITDNAQAGTLTAAGDIRIRIPHAFNMIWDTTDTSANMGGTASGKVNSTVSFPDNKTLFIDVTSDFAAGDTLTVAGLSFTNFSDLAGVDNLELYIDSGHVLSTEDTKTIQVGTKAIISSAASQTFAVGDWSTRISPITVTAITDNAEINTSDEIRIRIPSSLSMVWDTTDTYAATIGGNAAAKVSGTVSFLDEKTLLVNVTSDFAEGDAIIISGLNFKGFFGTSAADNLQLYVDGAADATADADDDKTISIESRNWMSPVGIVRGQCGEEMSCYDTLIDGDLTTGNLWSGRNGIFDLGREYLVTHIRIYAQYDNKWRLYVGNTPTDCLSDGTDVTGLWRIGHDSARWYEKKVAQISGRYMRLKWENVGGYPGDNTLTEVEFFGIPQDEISMSSAADQEFEVAQAATPISQITITESATSPTITVSNDIRIIIPLTLNMAWDTSDTTAIVGGTAATKVSSTVSYPDEKTLLINVTDNFAAGDTLTVSDLSFKDFLGKSDPANLQLSVDGGTSVVTTDPKTIRIWNWISPVGVVDANPDCCDMHGPGFVIDNHTATGNTPWGYGYALVDLGDTYTVTAIRVYTVSGYDYWDVSIGDDTTDCTLVNSYGTKVKDEWYVGGDGWCYTEIDPPVSGRYIRIDKDQGGGLNDKGLREIDFQGYKTTEGEELQIASAADQTFEKDQATIAIQTINISYYPSNGSITSADDVRISIPASFNMTWDTTDTTATIGGSAAGKVSTMVSYPDNKTLLIDVTEDFSAGDTLAISDLSLTNFSAQSPKNHLQLSVDGGISVAATDSKYIWVIHWKTPSIVYDGCTNCCGADNVVDGDTGTGNCTWGGPLVFDMGSTQTVRHMRIYSGVNRRWVARVSDTVTGCDTNDWTCVKWEWWPGTGQWSETPVIPTSGRYIKLYVDVGGPIGSGTIREFQYQAD